MSIRNNDSKLTSTEVTAKLNILKAMTEKSSFFRRTERDMTAEIILRKPIEAKTFTSLPKGTSPALKERAGRISASN